MKIYNNILAVCLAAAVQRSLSFSFQSPIVPKTPEVFPADMEMKRIEGGSTLRTYHMPPNGERCHYMLSSDGRPLKAKVEMWLGPNRRTHQMVMDLMDGRKTPFRAILKFKKGAQVLKVSTNGNVEYPLNAGVRAVTAADNDAVAAITKKLWDENEPVILQGGDTEGNEGALRSFPIDDNVDSVHVIISSGEIGRKSTKLKMEVLQGPNNPRQFYDLHLSGGSQPYHCILATPGEGAVVRIRSKHFLEFPTKVLVLPYEKTNHPVSGITNPTRQWWE